MCARVKLACIFVFMYVGSFEGRCREIYVQVCVEAQGKFSEFFSAAVN